MAGRVARPAQEPDKGNAADEPGGGSDPRPTPAEEDAERVRSQVAMMGQKAMVARLMGKGSNLTCKRQRASRPYQTDAGRGAAATARRYGDDEAVRSPAPRGGEGGTP